MASTEQQRAQSSAKAFKLRSQSMLGLSLLAAGLPFAPMPLIASGGLLLGAKSASLYARSKKRDQKRNIDRRFKHLLPKDGEMSKQLYLGHAMDFLEYSDNVESFMEHKDIGKYDYEVKKRYDAYAFQKMEPFNLSNDLQTRHMALLGSTGVGKTEFLLAMLSQQLKRGGGALIFDAKGADETLAKINELCRLAGREDDLFFINPDRPQISHTYNPLLYGSVRQVISTTMKLTSKGGQEYFRNLSRMALVAAVVCLQSQPGRPAFNFTDLAVIFSDVKHFFELFNSMDKNPEYKENRQFVWTYLKNWLIDTRDGETVFNEALYRERLNGLQTTMMDFSHTEYRHILNDYSPDIELKQVIMENRIVVISLPALSDREGATIFGKLVLADLARAIGQLQSERTKPQHPFMAFMDEYGSIKDESHQDLFQLARSANIFLCLSVQSKGFLDNEDKVFADNVLSNCWTHVYLDVRDPNTRENAAKLAGKTIREFKTESDSESFAYSNKNSESGQIRQENTSLSKSSGFKQTREDILMPEDFNAEPGEAIIVAKYGVMKIRLPMVKFAKTPASVDEITLPYYEKAPRHGLNLMPQVLKRDKALIEQLKRDR